MTKIKMTLHRALAELKLIDSKIDKAITSVEPSGIMQKDKLVNGFYEKDSFEKEAKSKLQSVADLIDRKFIIKSAVVKANSTTFVEIAGKKMSISDAINFKGIVEFKKTLIGQLKARHAQAKTKVEQKNKVVDDNALKLAEAALQKDNVKINEGDAVAITEPYIEKNRFLLVDPLDVEQKVELLENEVNQFETEIDAVLSEINALTVIEI
jgi:hypothetical protein